MKASKREKLEAAGWKVGSVPEFLRLSEEESDFVELKLPPSESLQEELETWEAASDEDSLKLERRLADVE
jgi:hypothetical protein